MDIQKRSLVSFFRGNHSLRIVWLFGDNLLDIFMSNNIYNHSKTSSYKVKKKSGEVREKDLRIAQFLF